MIRRMIVALALLAGVVAGAWPAQGMCRPGRIGIENGRPVFEPPHCDPYPP